MRTPLYTVELLYSNPLKWGHLCIQWNSSIPTPWNEDTSVYSGTPLFQHPEMRTPLYTVELLYSNTLKWGHLCIQWNSSIPTPWNEDTSVYSGTPLFQHPEMRTPLYTVELLYSKPTEMRTPLYTVELLYSNPLKWGHLCIQWNSSIPTPWNEDTSVYNRTPLFQYSEMRTPLYTVELLYSNPLKWGHLYSKGVYIAMVILYLSHRGLYNWGSVHYHSLSLSTRQYSLNPPDIYITLFICLFVCYCYSCCWL